MPPDVEYELPCNEASLNPVQQLVEIHSKHQLNTAPHLKAASLNPRHIEKMKVGRAFSLLNRDTAAALRLLVQKGDLPPAALTTG